MAGFKSSRQRKAVMSKLRTLRVKELQASIIVKSKINKLAKADIKRAEKLLKRKDPVSRLFASNKLVKKDFQINKALVKANERSLKKDKQKLRKLK